VRVRVNKSGARWLRWAQGILFATAGLTLGYCLFFLADMWFYQEWQGEELERLAARASLKAPVAPEAAVVPKGGVVGLLEIPRLGVSAVVAQGTDEGTLRHAVGHIEDTALPGLGGNVGIAGHRDTFFRPLRNIRLNDIILVSTPWAKYRYRVTSTKVVGPEAVEVLAPTASETLTLVTCYPFYYVGSAPDRFIVRAERIGG
jgi:sortase A